MIFHCYVSSPEGNYQGPFSAEIRSHVSPRRLVQEGRPGHWRCRRCPRHSDPGAPAAPSDTASRRKGKEWVKKGEKTIMDRYFSGKSASYMITLQYMCIYICIYRERERERKKELYTYIYIHIGMYIYIYVYIYIYI